MTEKNSEGLDDKDYNNSEVKGNPVENKGNGKGMKEMRKKLESIKDFILKKYKFTKAIGIVPPQASKMFDEENELSEEEKKKKPLHLVVVMPDNKEKQFNEVKAEIVKKVQETKQNVWLNLFLEKDLWEICMDSKYQIIEAIGMAFPLYDKGILGELRVAEIHKSLVLKKFEKYVYSYIIGGSLVRGEASKSSDVDTYIIIDDTDVKRMPRLELKDKLRNIIYSYVMQASEMAGVKNELNVQVYLLTEFWDGVKDANPIFYTFLRDGVPLYDRGGFLPWKLLLKMGKIKPSPESIDMFMSVGDKMNKIVGRKLTDIVMGDIYWGVITPSQGLLMLYGVPPTTQKETVKEIKRVFVNKEKLLEKKYADILEEIVIKYYKGYEHGKVKEISGKDVDRLLKNSQEYLERLKELRKELEKKMQKKTFEEIYNSVFKIMKNLFGKKSEKALIKKFEEEMVNKGKESPRLLHTLNELVSMKKKYSGKKKQQPSKYKFERLRKDSVYLVEALTEYGQRREMGLLEKMKVDIVFNDRHAELFLTKPSFLVVGNKIKKISEKIEDSNMQEFNNVVNDYKGKRLHLDSKFMDILKKELGDFKINL